MCCQARDLRTEREAPRETSLTSQLWRSIPWLELACSPAFLSICAAHFSHNWGQYLLLSWIPKYLTHLGLTLDRGGLLYALPFICAALLDNAAAWIADELLLQRLHFSLRATRKTMQAVAMLVPMACLLSLSWTTDPYVAVGFLTAAVSFGSLSHSGYRYEYRYEMSGEQWVLELRASEWQVPSSSR